MTVTLHNTEHIVSINGTNTRVWEGETDSGIRVTCFVALIAVKNEDDQKQFGDELKEVTPSSDTVRSFPLRMIL